MTQAGATAVTVIGSIGGPRLRGSTSGGTPAAATKYVTVIIDLTPIREVAGPARLLDMVEGRSKQAFKQWLADRLQAWRDGVQCLPDPRGTSL